MRVARQVETAGDSIERNRRNNGLSVLEDIDHARVRGVLPARAWTPTRPIHVLIGFSPGGSADIVVRCEVFAGR